MKKEKIDINKLMKKWERKYHTCRFCGKKITKKVWESQSPYVLECFHSLGGEIGSYGDPVFDAMFCSRKCLDELIKICKNFSWLDWLVGTASYYNKPIKKILKKEEKFLKKLDKIKIKKLKVGEK